MKAVLLVEDIGNIFLNLVGLHYERKEKEKSTERALTQPQRRRFAETFLDIGVARGVDRGQWRAVAESGWPWSLFGRSERPSGSIESKPSKSRECGTEDIKFNLLQRQFASISVNRTASHASQRQFASTFSVNFAPCNVNPGACSVNPRLSMRPVVAVIPITTFGTQ
ncbi:hypothetical protein B0H10DRAFT_1946813 [Mycena sp. CBHHK59/15]|nr:hypothetical protein B0H10DRAFT_1946813 [Mycena sp. CBHHK59/15]